MALLLVFSHVFTSFSSLFLQFIQNTLNRGIKWQQKSHLLPRITLLYISNLHLSVAIVALKTKKNIRICNISSIFSLSPQR